MQTSRELSESIPHFKTLFKEYIIAQLSHRDRLNARRSCRFFKDHIPLNSLTIQGKVLPSLDCYTRLLRRVETVKSLIISPQVELMRALTNKALFHDDALNYLPIDRFQTDAQDDPASFSLTLKKQKIKLDFTDMKSDYFFRNLLYPVSDLFFLVCDRNQRESLDDLRSLVADLKSFYPVNQYPVIIVLAINSQPLSENTITHIELEDFVNHYKITNWYKVDVTNYHQVMNVLTLGLRYVMMHRYPDVRDQLEARLLNREPSEKTNCCTIS